MVPQIKYNYKRIIDCIVLLIIICAITLWIIKYGYPYLKQKLTRTLLYIIMGIISIVLFGFTLFILLFLVSLLLNSKRVHVKKDYLDLDDSGDEFDLNNDANDIIFSNP